MNLNDTPSRGKLIEADLYTMHQDFEPWVITHADYPPPAEAATEIGADEWEPASLSDAVWFWAAVLGSASALTLASLAVFANF